MAKYGQYCPVAQALELVGDRWTLLIIRDMLTGTQHFNDLQRGLPGLSRGLLSQRLKQLQAFGLVEKQITDSGRQSTAYCLTDAGRDLNGIIHAFLVWGTKWAFGDPSIEQLDPLLLMWWIHNRVNRDRLPEDRTVVQFDFYGAKSDTFWLVLTPDNVDLCITDPGYDINLLVRADLSTFFKVWLGRITYQQAVDSEQVHVDGLPTLTRAFPDWFAWSPASSVVSAYQAQRELSP